MRTYEDELAGYPAVYAAAVTSGDDDRLRRAEELVRGRYLYAIGSGGALPAAVVAVDLHRGNGGRGEALSPLAFVERARTAEDAVVFVFSARAKHPDTAFAVRHAISRDIPVVLVTQRTPEELSEPFTSPLCFVLTVPSPQGADGFLATQSVIAMIVTAARVFRAALPNTPEWRQRTGGEGIRGRLLVLYGPGDQAVASDIEVRFNELGVSDVQLVDYRNFAHGRHVGLSRHIEDTTALLIVSPDSEPIAQRTSAKLPPSLHQLQLRTDERGVPGLLELMHGASLLLAQRAVAIGVNAHKPRVATFGRDLYHLSFNRLYPAVRADPVSRKLAQLGLTKADREVTKFYSDSYQTWRIATSRKRFGALLLDYDGTCVETADRWDPPLPRIQEEVLRLLSEGLTIGFASGRGDSLYHGLRTWIPEDYWAQVHLGLHNGTWRTTLSAPIEEMPGQPTWSEELTVRLQDLVETGLITVRVNSHQVTVGSLELPLQDLLALVEAVVRRAPALPLTVAASGHSVDVIEKRSGKADYLTWLERELSTQILVIGDQGNLGGNDFDMLAASETSLTVHKCSADPTRCWNIATAGTRGPLATTTILASLAKRTGGHALKIPRLEVK